MRLPRSLRWQLVLLIGAAILAVALVQGLLAYRNALREVDSLLDTQMQQTALALRAGLPLDARAAAPLLPRAEENTDFIVQVWTNEGLRIFESAFGAALPQMAVLGFADVPVRGTVYRVFSLQTRAQVIQVAQDVAVRQTMARGLAWRTLWPIALLAPVLAWAVWWLLGRALAPVQRVRRDLAQRQAQDLAPVPAAGLPDEVEPLVRELNQLLQRVRSAFDSQQQFVADAAHELRSPLAALSLQIQALQRAENLADAPARQQATQQAITRLQAGVERATRLVEQLLALARQEAAPAPATPVALAPLLREALADTAPLAQARGLDLGLEQLDEGAADWAVPGHAAALQGLVRNLLDNACKYTPAATPGASDVEASTGTAGRIDVSLLRAPGTDPRRGGRLVVEDSGPGIAEAERARVLQRFVRGSTVQGGAGAPVGSGLGLAIAQATARQHGASLVLDTSPRLGGLRVQVVWPDGSTG